MNIQGIFPFSISQGHLSCKITACHICILSFIMLAHCFMYGDPSLDTELESHEIDEPVALAVQSFVVE